MALNKNEIKADLNRVGSGLDRLDSATSKFRRKSGSIISSAKGNIFEFPVFISNSVPMEYATATSSLLEQVYASYLQMAISINPVIDHTNAVNGLQFAGLRSDTNKYLEYTDTMWQHDVCHAEYTNDEGVVCEFNLIGYSDAEARAILESVDYQPLSEFEHYLGEAFDPKSYYKNGTPPNVRNKNKGKNKQEPVRMDDTGERYARQAAADAKETSDQFEASKDALYKSTAEHKAASDSLNRAKKAFENSSQKLEKMEDKYNKLMTRIENASEAEKANLKKEIELVKKEKEQLKDDKEKKKLEMEKLQQEIDKNKNVLAKDKRDAKWDAEDRANKQGQLANQARIKAPVVLRASDMDKLNTMKPILMTVDLNVKADNGTLSPVEYVVGVKTFNRMIDADILPEVVQYPLKEMDRITRKAKWRAGELKFFSDIVFRIKQKKQTAADKRDPKRKWYRRLYELAHMKGDAPTVNILNGGSVLGSFVMDKRGKTRSATGLVPNVSMVLSKTDVDNVKIETGIDLLNGHTASKFCNELFMMSLVVIDPDREQIKVLIPELHHDYDVHSIASVNRQIASLDSASQNMKDYFKLMNR